MEQNKLKSEQYWIELQLPYLESHEVSSYVTNSYEIVKRSLL
jgi:hypothetical protein